jgi:hypothetical protein
MTEGTARGSGRTYRMLQDALAAAIGGQRVTVVGWHYPDTKDLMKHMTMLPELTRRGGWKALWARETILVGSGPGQVRFRPGYRNDFDWYLKQFRGEDGPIFIDHYAQERRESYMEAQKRARNPE